MRNGFTLVTVPRVGLGSDMYNNYNTCVDNVKVILLNYLNGNDDGKISYVLVGMDPSRTNFVIFSTPFFTISSPCHPLLIKWLNNKKLNFIVLYDSNCVSTYVPRFRNFILNNYYFIKLFLKVVTSKLLLLAGTC